MDHGGAGGLFASGTIFGLPGRGAPLGASRGPFSPYLLLAGVLSNSGSRVFLRMVVPLYHSLSKTDALWQSNPVAQIPMRDLLIFLTPLF